MTSPYRQPQPAEPKQPWWRCMLGHRWRPNWMSIYSHIYEYICDDCGRSMVRCTQLSADSWWRDLWRRWRTRWAERRRYREWEKHAHPSSGVAGLVLITGAAMLVAAGSVGAVRLAMAALEWLR